MSRMAGIIVVAAAAVVAAVVVVAAAVVVVAAAWVMNKGFVCLVCKIILVDAISLINGCYAKTRVSLPPRLVRRRRRRRR